MVGSIVGILGSLVLMLIGAAMTETMFAVQSGIGYHIIGILLGALFFIPGLILCIASANNLREEIICENGSDIAYALAKDEDAYKNRDSMQALLANFREHYAEFFKRIGIKENEKIQWEATQIYRNLLEFRKARLKRLNITCETTIKNMVINRYLGITKKTYTDGKYDITEVEEEIAAKTIYKKDDKKIFTQTGCDLANYTVIHTKQVGDDKIICPSCGVESTREELLDGCDYCGTKFIIEDLGERVAEFAIRPDYNVAYSKYTRARNKITMIMTLCVLAAVVAMFVGYAFIYAPKMLENTGIFLTILSMLFAIVVSSIVFVPAFLIVYAWIIPLITLLFGSMNIVSKAILKKLKLSPQKDKSFTVRVRKFDRNFSINNFYSGLQNKISSIIYADTKAQLNAFSAKDISHLLGRYSNVIDIETEFMGITSYTTDDKLQHMVVEVCMKLLENHGNKCKYKPENWRLKLIKSVDCQTQVPCAPSIMICKSCGASLDLLKGKECSSCGNKLEFEKYDWVIEDIEFFKKVK